MSDIAVMEQHYQEELLRLQEAELAFVKAHRIYFYQPKGQQVFFHQSKAHVRLAQGKNRSGKTTGGVVENVAFCLGFRPWLLPASLKDKPIEWILDHPSVVPSECRTPINRACKGLIVEDDWDVVDDILVVGTEAKPAKLPFYIPAGAIVGKPIKNSLGHICQYNIRSIHGGYSILKMDTEKSYKNDPGSFEGANADFIHYDEPKCKGLRAALKRGLADTYGYEWFTFTALAEVWMKNSLYDKAGIDPEIAAFNFDTEDLITAGFVSRQGWDAFANSLDDEMERAARIDGKWAHLSGLVYPQFQARDAKDGGHLIEPLGDEWVADHCTCFLAVDPHPRNPMAALILACDDRGRWIIWRELYQKALIEEFCEGLDVLLSFKRAGQLERQLVVHQIMDPLGFIDDPVDGTNWADEFNACGYTFDKATKDKSRGIMNVRAAFKTNQLVVCRPDKDGHGGCPRTIWELQNYVFGNWSPATQAGRDPKERPVDKDDHMVENLYRLVNLHPFHIPVEERNPNISPRDLAPI